MSWIFFYLPQNGCRTDLYLMTTASFSGTKSFGRKALTDSVICKFVNSVIYFGQLCTLGSNLQLPYGEKKS